MRTVTRTRLVVVVGRRPHAPAADALGDVSGGGEAAVFVLGLEPSPAQLRFNEEALAMAAERRFTLTSELIPAPTWLEERLLPSDELRVLARPREARRWRIGPGPTLSAGA